MNNIQPIHVFAIFKVKEGEINTVLDILQTVRKETLREKGNLFYQVHRGNGGSNTIVLFEGYTDEAAVTAHRNAAHYKDLIIGKIIPLLENREVILTSPVAEQ